MNTLTILIISLLLNFNCQASFWYKDLEFIAIENFKVAKEADKIFINFDYIINNPNWYNITIKPSIMNLKISDTDCGDVLIKDKINIKRKTKAAYKFSLIGNASKFIKSSFSSIFTMLSKRKIDFLLIGDLRAGVFGFTKKWKMDFTYSITFKEFMSFF